MTNPKHPDPTLSPETLAAVKQGLAESAQGLTVDRGSFSDAHLMRSLGGTTAWANFRRKARQAGQSPKEAVAAELGRRRREGHAKKLLARAESPCENTNNQTS